MEMKGEQRIPAPREKVWEALNDPEVLKASIPGCQELEQTESGGFTAKVKAKVGPVSATFTGAVELSNIDPPKGYTISGEGKGGVAGFAKGGADVALADEGGETLLTYTVNAQVGGKLAQIGSRLIDSTAKKMAGQFFTKFSEVVGSEAAASPADESAPAAKSTPAAEAAPEPAAPPAEAPKTETPKTETPAEPEPQADHHHDDHPEIPAELTDEALNKDVGKGAKTGVWVIGLFVVVLILLAIFGLGGGEPDGGAGGGQDTESHSN
ncbi:MAG: hypothetical protein Kilf2KO_00660 [Rhodospirillales bacterium]